MAKICDLCGDIAVGDIEIKVHKKNGLLECRCDLCYDHSQLFYDYLIHRTREGRHWTQEENLVDMLTRFIKVLTQEGSDKKVKNKD